MLRAANRSPFEPLLLRTGRRRRARRALALAARCLVPGLAAALALAGAWRLTGADTFLALALATLILPALAGIAVSFTADDALLAAAELDRRAGLDGLLATGFEISRGRIRTFLAPEALRRAEAAASSLDGSEIPLAPPDWVRYLALPAALVLAILALPRGGAPWGAGFRGERLTAAGEAEALEPGRAIAGHRLDEARETQRRGLRRDDRRAIAAYKAARKREADRAAKVKPLPPAPRIAPRIAPRPARTGEAKSAARASLESRAEGGGTGDGEAAAAPEEADAVRLGGPGAGPVDLEEAAVFRERFPEYEDLVRRYFAGR